MFPIFTKTADDTKLIGLVIINILICTIGVITFGLAGILNDCNNPDFVQYGLVDYCKQVNQPVVAYFAVGGIFTCIISAFSIFVLFDTKLLVDYKSITLRILVFANIFILAFNFAFATLAATILTTWKKQIEVISKKPGWKIIGIVQLQINYLTAFSVIQFVLILPCIVLTYMHWNQILHNFVKKAVVTPSAPSEIEITDMK